MNRFNLRIALITLTVLIFLTAIAITSHTEVRLFQDVVSHSVKGEFYKGFINYKAAMIYKTDTYSDAAASWKPGVEQAFPRWIFRNEAFYYRNNAEVFRIQVADIAPGKLTVRIYSLNQLKFAPPTVMEETIILPNGNSIRWSSRDRDSIFIYADEYLNKSYKTLYEVSDSWKSDAAESELNVSVESLKFSRLPWEQTARK